MKGGPLSDMRVAGSRAALLLQGCDEKGQSNWGPMSLGGAHVPGREQESQSGQGRGCVPSCTRLRGLVRPWGNRVHCTQMTLTGSVPLP